MLRLILQKLKSRTKVWLTVRRLKSGRVAIRASAVRRFIDWSNYGRRDVDVALAVGPLCEALQDRDTNVGELAARALLQIADKRAVSPLCEALQDSHWQVRTAAAKALGAIGDTRAVEALCFSLDSECKWHSMEARDSFVFNAIRALGDIADARAVGALCSQLSSDHAETRGAAAAALGQIGDARAVDALCAALNYPATRRDHFNNDADDARGSAARALGRIGDDRAVDPLCAALVDPLSAEGLDSAVRERRRQAAWGLGKLVDPRAIDPLCEALRDDDLEVRRKSLEALSEILSKSLNKASSESLKRVAGIKGIVIEMASDGEGFFGGWISTDCTQVTQLAHQELVRRKLLK
jgi:HEAT repeat protein